MTSGLRKIHKYSWLIIAVVVPVLLFFAIKDLYIFSPKKEIPVTQNNTKKGAVSVSENELLKIVVFSDAIEVVLKKTLKDPSSVLYSTDAEGNKKEVIGQLSKAGVYSFENKGETILGVVLYDALKNEMIAKLQF